MYVALILFATSAIIAVVLSLLTEPPTREMLSGLFGDAKIGGSGVENIVVCVEKKVERGGGLRLESRSLTDPLTSEKVSIYELKY